MDIGTLLKLKRKELNLSVKQVVDSLKSYNISISEKTLYGWENNYRQPDAYTFLILCAIYQISNVLDYFLNEQTKDYSTKESILIKKYRQLTAEQQGAVENNIDYFIQVNKKDETTENGEDPFENKVG